MTEDPLRATVSQKAALFDADERVLLLRTADGRWEFPGGRIGAGEDAIPGLRREVREETGLDVTVGRPAFTDAWLNDRGQGRYAVVYRCATGRTAVALSEEHVDYAWTTPEAALEEYLVTLPRRAALECALDTPAPAPAADRNRTNP